MRPSLNKRGKYQGDFDGMMSTKCPTRSVDFFVCLFDSLIAVTLLPTAVQAVSASLCLWEAPVEFWAWSEGDQGANNSEACMKSNCAPCSGHSVCHQPLTHLCPRMQAWLSSLPRISVVPNHVPIPTLSSP